MPWARFDELFPSHRKVRRLSDAAFRLQASAVCWSSRYMTNGQITEDDLPDVADIRKPEQAASELVSKGLWHLPGHDCRSEFCWPHGHGWLIHDFLDYNPSREEVETKRQADAERKRKGRSSESRQRPRGRTADSNGTREGVHAESNESPPVPTPVVPNGTTFTRPDPIQTPAESAATMTLTQKSKRITDEYTARVPLSNWPAINGVVLKALKSERYADAEIHQAMLRLASEGRSVTVETLRTELEGFAPRQQANKATQRTQQGLSVIRNLQAESRGEIA